ncbi:hypothetical protein V1387_18235 [Allomuricauda taeanensis]|uniref:hypothetical protein n=1 Tax=Flagellimonas taeanensis TaxID=1005926 RepID=UPI002E7ABECB|nr:hypothetical protein [Allomuricauda taeanensis]MEE1964630.1 hypothetical protein [Allomuricauda taeanensis]
MEEDKNHGKRDGKKRKYKQEKESGQTKRRSVDDVATRIQVKNEINFFWNEQRTALFNKIKTDCERLIENQGEAALESPEGKELLLSFWKEYKNYSSEEERELLEIQQVYTAHLLPTNEEVPVQGASGNELFNECHEDLFSFFESKKVPVAQMDEIERDILANRKQQHRKTKNPLPLKFSIQAKLEKLKDSIPLNLSNLEKLIEKSKSNKPATSRVDRGRSCDMEEKFNRLSDSSSGYLQRVTSKNGRAGISPKIESLIKKFGEPKETASSRSIGRSFR